MSQQYGKCNYSGCRNCENNELIPLTEESVVCPICSRDLLPTDEQPKPPKPKWLAKAAAFGGLGMLGVSAYLINAFYSPPPTPEKPPELNNCPVINSALHAEAVVSKAFSYEINATEKAATYSAQPLPAGLSLAGNKISGTPTEKGLTKVTLSASNASCLTPKSVQLELSVKDDAPPSVVAPQPLKNFFSKIEFTYSIPNEKGEKTTLFELPLTTSSQLKSGFFYNVEFSLLEKGYVYISEKQPSSRCKLLFPNAFLQNPVDLGKNYFILGKAGSLRILNDEEVGMKTLYLRVVSQPIAELDDKFNQQQPEVNKDFCSQNDKSVVVQSFQVIPTDPNSDLK